MKKIGVMAITAFIILIVFAVGAYLIILISLDWKELSRKRAPEGALVAFHMESMSEAGLAPYGCQVVLVPSYNLLGQYYTEPVFAGYCNIKYQWVDSHTLQINYGVDCKAEKIMRKLTNYEDINIKYVTIDDK